MTAAIASAQRAAYGIDASIRGEEAALRRAPPPLPAQWPEPVGYHTEGRPDTAPRKQPELRTLELGANAFAEVVGVLTEAEARAEAQRCLSCGTCRTCRACLDLFGCPAFYLDGATIQIEPALCTGCGACADLCPNGAIHSIEELE